MTLLGVPEPKFNIGKSSTTAAPTSGSQMDMSLDDMIKNRRKQTRSSTRRSAARKPNAADKAMGRQRATRAAAVAARRGIQSSTKPSAMEIERQVYRQTRMNTPKGGKGGPRNRKDMNAQVRARKQEKAAKKQQKGKAAAALPFCVQGSKRPPSKKAVSAAVSAMQEKGFKVPEGMQMVISFAPAAAESKGKSTQQGKGKQGKGKSTQQGKGKSTQKGKGKGGGRKK